MASDHRKTERLLGHTLGPLLVRFGTTAFIADVKDISVAGVALIAFRNFPLGTSFIIESGPKGQNLPSALNAELRHTSEHVDGRLILGCQFSRLLTTDDFEALA